MRVRILSLGTRMPAWVESGVAEYLQRLPREWRCELLELPLAQRSRKSNPQQSRADEGRRLLAAIPSASQLIALDERGTHWSTAQLAEQLSLWLGAGRDVALAIGGPDGLDSQVLAQAEQRWSLSMLTLPHALVRILVLEQLYRAWTILNNHPYHRA